jgi:hypothetical protein
MKTDRSEAFWDRMKSLAVCVVIGAIGVYSVAINPRTKAQFFELDHFSPGKVAPETAGVDVTGKPMKLSDFRGKIVMLDFFGNW